MEDLIKKLLEVHSKRTLRSLLISNNFPIKCFILIDPDGNMLCWNFSKWLSLRKDTADNACRGVMTVKRVERTVLPGCTRKCGLVGVSTGNLPYSGPVLLPMSKLMLHLMRSRAPIFRRNSHAGSDKGLTQHLFCV